MNITKKQLACILTTVTVVLLYLFKDMTGDLAAPFGLFIGGLGLCALVAWIEVYQEGSYE